MRHGPAEDHAPSGRDADRPLSASGIEVVERAARMLAADRPGPLGRVVTSPLLRARQTARIVARIAGRFAPAVDDITELVREVHAAGIEALLVGHNPTVEAFAANLEGGVSGFRTATIVEVAEGPEGFRALRRFDPHTR
jgi:phosphohistidine phosphatase